MFIPLALTKTLAMSMAAVLAIVLMPILLGYFVRGKIRPESEHPISRSLIGAYQPLLIWCLDHKKKVLIAAAVLALISLIPITGIPNPFGKVPLVKGLQEQQEIIKSLVKSNQQQQDAFAKQITNLQMEIEILKNK